MFDKSVRISGAISAGVMWSPTLELGLLIPFAKQY
jgi:hypothetical protein